MIDEEGRVQPGEHQTLRGGKRPVGAVRGSPRPAAATRDRTATFGKAVHEAAREKAAEAMKDRLDPVDLNRDKRGDAKELPAPKMNLEGVSSIDGGGSERAMP